MNHPTGDAASPAAAEPTVPGGRRPLLATILTDVHFWIPVVVLAIGLGLLAFIS